MKDWGTLSKPAQPWTCPGGTLVAGSQIDRDQWLDLRQSMICASDVAAIFGASRWGDSFTVWADKTGRRPRTPATDAQRRGQIFEDAIVQLWSERYADFPIETRRQGLMRSRRFARAGATVDRLSICGYYGTASRCLVEVKSQADMSEWEDDDVPAEYQFQGLWQLFVTGRDHVHYVALGSRFVPVHRVISRDEPLIAQMLMTLEEWWQTHIVEGIEPIPTDRASDAMREIYAGTPGAVKIANDELADLVLGRKAVAERLAEIKRELAALDAQIQAEMGDATELKAPDERTTLASWNVSSKTIDGANADWRKAHSELAEAYSVPGPDVIDTHKLVEQHPELIAERSLRYRRTFSIK